jgi:hypothetical protein
MSKQYFKVHTSPSFIFSYQNFVRRFLRFHVCCMTCPSLPVWTALYRNSLRYYEILQISEAVILKLRSTWCECKHGNTRIKFALTVLMVPKMLTYIEVNDILGAETELSVLRLAKGGRQRSRSSNAGKVKNVLFSTSPEPALVSTQPPAQWVTVELSPGVKYVGNYSPPTSADVKRTWIYTATPPYAFMA